MWQHTVDTAHVAGLLLALTFGFLFLLLVFSIVYYASLRESLLALNTGAAFAAMLSTALVAAPCLGVVYAETLAYTRDVCLCNAGIGSHYPHIIVCSCCGSCVDG